MALAIRLLVIGALAYGAYLALRHLLVNVVPRSGASSRFPCATCRHCKREFDDGVLCMFDRRETFKNEVHIANCGSYSKRGTG